MTPAAPLPRRRAVPAVAASPRAMFETLAAPFSTAPEVVTRHYRIAGVPVQVDYGSAAILNAFDPALGHLASAPAIPPAEQLLVWDCDTSHVAMPPFPWRAEDVGARGEVAAATGEGIQTAWFGVSQALSMYDGKAHRGLFWVPDAAALPPWERAAPLRTLLHWICGAAGLRFAHAAAVGTSAGGALLAGRGGSGKSTTALLCLLAGMHYAGDDYVAVGTEEGQPAAFSLYGTAKVTAETLALTAIPGSALLAAPAGGEKGVVLASALGRLVERMPLRALIVPRIVSGRDTTARRASAAEVMLALAPTTMLQLPGNGAATFEALAALARSLPGWVVELGPDLERIPRVIAGITDRSRG